MPQYICDECGKTFSGNRWTKKYKHTFCCQECDRTWKRKERYKKGGRIPF